MTGFVLFGSILFILIGTIVWAAFRAGEDTGAALEPAERRDATIEALRDLELEFRTGKLTEEEYRVVRTRLESEALAARDAAASDSDGSESARVCGACESPLDGKGAFCPSCGASTAV